MRESEFIKLSNALAVLYVGSPDLKHGIKQIRSLQIQHLKERRKTVKASTPVQQRKGKTVRNCGTCQGGLAICSNNTPRCRDCHNFDGWSPIIRRTASPVTLSAMSHSKL